MNTILVTCSKGLEYLLEEELLALGLTQTKVSPQGVSGEASLEVIYKICLWTRIGNRVLLNLFEEIVTDATALHHVCRQFPWAEVFDPSLRLMIHFQGQTEWMRNSMFGAQVIKDGLVDYCRDQNLQRPTIDREDPQICLRAYLKKNDGLAVYLDLVGYSLHQRGYRLEAGTAPLKETLAAALLWRAKWPLLCQENNAFQDPFCGSGTLVIEAAMIAAKMAPGLLREDQHLPYWKTHDAQLWMAIRHEAELQRIRPANVFAGSDANSKAIAMAQANAQRAGVSHFVDWKVTDITQDPVVAIAAKGLLVTNPPYGERLADIDSLLPLYQTIGKMLHRSFQTWEAAVLTMDLRLAKAMGLRSYKQYKFHNGPLECYLYCMHLGVDNRWSGDAPIKPLSEHAQMFANRLKKNEKHLRNWAMRQQIECYRLYDADLPEYAYAIDRYQDYIVLQEYAPPASIPELKAEKRRQDVLRAVPEVLQCSPSQMVVKQRTRQKGLQQYEKMDQQFQFLTVKEGRASFLVNLHDYLDTGLFLDHRLLRSRFAKLKPGLQLLNCFCYTGTASVQAALAGAITTNVDLSRTYLTWAQDNFRLNDLDHCKHRFIQEDCLVWLAHSQDRFDVIFLDPPTFSNSKRMSQTLDIARDHEALIHQCMRLLKKQGELYFSTPLRQFKLNPTLKDVYQIQDITKETIDLDFKRDAKIHHCFLIKHLGE